MKTYEERYESALKVAMRTTVDAIDRDLAQMADCSNVKPGDFLVNFKKHLIERQKMAHFFADKPSHIFGKHGR